MKTKHISPKRKAYIALMRTLMAIAAILTGALVLFLIVYVLAKGIPNISWELLSTSPSYLSAKIGILPSTSSSPPWSSSCPWAWALPST